MIEILRKFSGKPEPVKLSSLLNKIDLNNTNEVIRGLEAIQVDLIMSENGRAIRAHITS